MQFVSEEMLFGKGTLHLDVFAWCALLVLLFKMFYVPENPSKGYTFCFQRPS